VLEVRDAVTKALEDARNDKTVGKSQEARIELTVPGSVAEVLKARGLSELAEMFIVADVSVAASGEDEALVGVRVAPAEGEKCPRCWNHRHLAPSGVCNRCEAVLSQQS
jgi:isoleucyl-tRNA synthetase